MINIEIFSARNKEDVCNLVTTIQRDEFEIPITRAQQPDLEAIENFYQVGKGNFWVAEMNNKLIGTIALLDIGEDKCALRKMFVAKEYRGKEFGVGQKLLHHLLNWCKEKHIEEIYLGTTAKFIAAQKFYKKNGFEEITKAHLPLQFPVMEVDVKFYKYNIHTMTIPGKQVTIDQLQSFVDAFNAHDSNAIMTYMTDDCVFEASAGPDAEGEKFSGQEQVKQAFENVFKNFPDAQWADASHLVSGDRGLSEWKFTGTKLDGSITEVKGCDLFTFKDGKIAIKNSYRKNRLPIK